MGQHFFHPAFQFPADEVFHRNAPQLEKQEGIFVDAHPDPVEYGSRMLAQNGIIGAAAADLQFPGTGEQAAFLGEQPGCRRGQVPVEQRFHIVEGAGTGFLDFFPELG